MEEEQNGLKIVLQYQMSLSLLDQFTMFPETKMHFEVIWKCKIQAVSSGRGPGLG